MLSGALPPWRCALLFYLHRIYVNLLVLQMLLLWRGNHGDCPPKMAQPDLPPACLQHSVCVFLKPAILSCSNYMFLFNHLNQYLPYANPVLGYKVTKTGLVPPSRRWCSCRGHRWKVSGYINALIITDTVASAAMGAAVENRVVSVGAVGTTWHRTSRKPPWGGMS